MDSRGDFVDLLEKYFTRGEVVKVNNQPEDVLVFKDGVLIQQWEIKYKDTYESIIGNTLNNEIFGYISRNPMVPLIVLMKEPDLYHTNFAVHKKMLFRRHQFRELVKSFMLQHGVSYWYYVWKEESDKTFVKTFEEGIKRNYIAPKAVVHKFNKSSSMVSDILQALGLPPELSAYCAQRIKSLDDLLDNVRIRNAEFFQPIFDDFKRETGRKAVRIAKNWLGGLK